VIFVSDGNAASDSVPGGAAHSTIQEAELMTLRACFAMVCTTDEIIGELNRLPALPATA